MLYEVTENSMAKRGAELLDVDGIVRYMSINSEQDGVTEIATIKDPQHVTTLITLINNAPLRTQGSNREATYFLALHFIDGTTFTRQYWAAPDNLFGELALPKEFQAAIEHAIYPKLAHIHDEKVARQLLSEQLTLQQEQFQELCRELERSQTKKAVADGTTSEQEPM